MKAFSRKQIEVLSSFVESNRFSTGSSNRKLHLQDISPHRGMLPAGVVWPIRTEEVSRILAGPTSKIFQSPHGARVPAQKEILYQPVAGW
ncbi:MAG TPA: hypothetical protein QF571_06940 [Desulfobacterales bacterium]|nr:hypothetical protein [Desulfobacterales bacterium]